MSSSLVSLPLILLVDFYFSFLGMSYKNYVCVSIPSMSESTVQILLTMSSLICSYFSWEYHSLQNSNVNRFCIPMTMVVIFANISQFYGLSFWLEAVIHHFQISTSILRKYSGPVDIWLSLLSAKFHLSGVRHCLLNEHPRRSLAAMAQHKSQWVWYVVPLLYYLA